MRLDKLKEAYGTMAKALEAMQEDLPAHSGCYTVHAYVVKAHLRKYRRKLELVRKRA